MISFDNNETSSKEPIYYEGVLISS